MRCNINLLFCLLYNYFYLMFSVDLIEIPSKQGKGMLKRVSEVFDCWFESGR